MRGAVLAYIGVGANLGDAQASVEKAIVRLGDVPHCALVRRSSLYRTDPVDATGPDFVNAVVGLDTSLSANELLAALQAIETAAGRERPWANAPRTLDLDILTYGDATITSDHLQVPHPRMRQRAFVLVPLAEIAPRMVMPAELLALAGQRVRKL